MKIEFFDRNKSIVSERIRLLSTLYHGNISIKQTFLPKRAKRDGISAQIGLFLSDKGFLW